MWNTKCFIVDRWENFRPDFREEGSGTCTVHSNDSQFYRDGRTALRDRRRLIMRVLTGYDGKLMASGTSAHPTEGLHIVEGR